MSSFKKHCIFLLCFLIISLILLFIFFKNIFISNYIIIDFSIHPFNICEKYPSLWSFVKTSYIISYIFSTFVISNLIYSFLFSKPNPNTKSDSSLETLDHSDLKLLVGENSNNDKLYIEEHGLYQNILITGTIGTGKTSSAMYPFTEQLISYNSNKAKEKLGILILDVKGNYHKQVSKLCDKYNRKKDLIVLSLNGNIKYNPLDKPNLKATVLANRLKTILTLFSPENSESYWLDKVEQLLAECIKLCRLYNDGYVTFIEIHKLVTLPNYYSSKISILREKFISGALSKEDCFNLLTAIEFFEKEFLQLDNRTLSILKSEITRITGCFVSDYQIKKVFSPEKEEINFHGFKDLISNRKNFSS